MRPQPRRPSRHLPARQRRKGCHFLHPNPWPTSLESHRHFPQWLGCRWRFVLRLEACFVGWPTWHSTGNSFAHCSDRTARSARNRLFSWRAQPRSASSRTHLHIEDQHALASPTPRSRSWATASRCCGSPTTPRSDFPGPSANSWLPLCSCALWPLLPQWATTAAHWRRSGKVTKSHDVPPRKHWVPPYLWAAAGRFAGAVFV
mmetsp:Transcript_81263/g.165534  ORF Transcript_81263/g.165534 Transcript_81263/m.165534 type:complete len:203 (-) Transcript_81263:21-629(-)